MTSAECMTYFKAGPGPLTSIDAGFVETARRLCTMGVLKPVFVPCTGEFWFSIKEQG